MKKIIILILLLSIQKLESSEKIHISEGRFTPMYGIEKNEVSQGVSSFYLDKYPVSEGDFFNFIEKNPQWGKTKIIKLFGDNNYLKINPRKKNFKNPVTYVSWFAANAYCASKKGRLPTTLEWEYVHAASQDKANAQKDEEYLNKLLVWYSKPSEEHDDLIIGKGRANYYGVHDLHSLIWEWTGDFNSVLMTNDNRMDGDKNQNGVCGASSIGARDKEDYSAFVRYSLRSSLQGSYTLESLGFRCAYEK